MLAGQTLNDGARPVGGTVVSNHDLEIEVRALTKDAGETVFDIVFVM